MSGLTEVTDPDLIAELALRHTARRALLDADRAQARRTGHSLGDFVRGRRQVAGIRRDRGLFIHGGAEFLQWGSGP